MESDLHFAGEETKKLWVIPIRSAYNLEMMLTKRPLKGPLSQTVWEKHRIWLISFAPVDGLDMPDTPTETNVMNLLFEAHFLYDRAFMQAVSFVLGITGLSLLYLLKQPLWCVAIEAALTLYIGCRAMVNQQKAKNIQVKAEEFLYQPAKS
jgi:hypothetical protein